MNIRTGRSTSRVRQYVTSQWETLTKNHFTIQSVSLSSWYEVSISWQEKYCANHEDKSVISCQGQFPSDMIRHRDTETSVNSCRLLLCIEVVQISDYCHRVFIRSVTPLFCLLSYLSSNLIHFWSNESESSHDSLLEIYFLISMSLIYFW